MLNTLLLVFVATCSVVRGTKNIIFVMADDTAWHGVGWHQSSQCQSDPNCAVLTPRMDALVKGALELDNHYTYRFCSPTRSSFLTGRYPFHVNQQNNAEFPWTAAAVHPNFTTVADMLRKAGYVTHQVGKWHLGLAKRGFTPEGRGFDSSLVFLSGSEEHFSHAKGAVNCKANCTGKCSTDLWEARSDWRTLVDNKRSTCKDGLVLTEKNAHTESACKAACEGNSACNAVFYITDSNTSSRCLLYSHCGSLRNTSYSGSTYLRPSTGRPAVGFDGVYSTDYATSRMIEIIHEASTQPKSIRKPFFAYLAFGATHEPIEAPQRFIDMYPKSMVPPERRTLNAMTTALDEAVGNITDKLHDVGLWDDTLLVFAADNGGPSGAGTTLPKSAESCANNYPLRGGKGLDFQGGVRTAAFVSGGVLPQSMRGQKATGYVHVCDWFATFAALAEIDAAEFVSETIQNGMPALDSMNMWPYLSGELLRSPRVEVPLSIIFDPNATTPERKLTAGGIISGDFKAVFGKQGGAGLHWNETYPTSASRPASNDPGCPQGCLFNISADPGEWKDISTSFPDKLAMLRSRIIDLASTLFQSDAAPDNFGTYDCNGCFTKVYGQYTEEGGRAWFGPWLDDTMQMFV